MSTPRYECPLCWSKARALAQYLADEGAHEAADSVIADAKKNTTFRSWRLRAQHLETEHWSKTP